MLSCECVGETRARLGCVAFGLMVMVMMMLARARMVLCLCFTLEA